MAGKDNLLRPEDLTPEELRERASRAGKASVKARRRKKTIKELITHSLDIKIKDIQDPGIRDEFLLASGSKGGDITIGEAIPNGIILGSIRGDSRMVKILLDLLGESPDLKLKTRETRMREKLAKKELDAEELKTEMADDGLTTALASAAEKAWDEDDQPD